MARLLIPAAIVLVALTLYALFEVLYTPRHQVRSMPKSAWLAAVVLLPLVGPVLWLLFGRARAAVTGPVSPRPASPDDDEAFLRTLRVQRRQAERERELDRRDAELRAREEEQRRGRGSGDGPDGDPAP